MGAGETDSSKQSNWFGDREEGLWGIRLPNEISVRDFCVIPGGLDIQVSLLLSLHLLSLPLRQEPPRHGEQLGSTCTRTHTEIGRRAESLWPENKRARSAYKHYISTCQKEMKSPSLQLLLKVNSAGDIHITQKYTHRTSALGFDHEWS